MTKQFLRTVCILVFSVLLTSCIKPDWGEIKVGKISNMYTKDQVEPLTKEDFSKFDKRVSRINQYNSYSSLKGLLLMAYLKAYSPGSTGGQSSDTMKFNDSLVKFIEDSKADTDILKNANPEMSYRYLLDDLSANYEYEQITKLKYQHKYLQNKNYRIYYIPIQVSIIPGKTSTEDYYAQVEFEIKTDTGRYNEKEVTIHSGVWDWVCYCITLTICKCPDTTVKKNIYRVDEAPHLFLIDLFPTKIFDNRKNYYSNAVMNALLLSASGELITPKGGGAAGVNFQEIEKIQQKFNSIQRIPIITSYIASDTEWNPNSTRFGWNIYPEKTLVDGEFKYIQNPDSYDFFAVVAVADVDTDTIRYDIKSKASWKILPQEHYYWYWWYLNPVSWFYTYQICEYEKNSLSMSYNPIKYAVPMITNCKRISKNTIQLDGSYLKQINEPEFIFGTDTNNISDKMRPISLTVNKAEDKAIATWQSANTSADTVTLQDKSIYAVMYKYNYFNIFADTNTNTYTDTGIDFFISDNLDTKRKVDTDTSQAPDTGKIEEICKKTTSKKCCNCK